MTCELETTRVYSCCLFEYISDCEVSLQVCSALKGRKAQAYWESLCAIETLFPRCTSSITWGPGSPDLCFLCHARHHSPLPLSPLIQFWFLDNSWFCFLGFFFWLILFFVCFFLLLCFLLVVPFSLKVEMVCSYFKNLTFFFKKENQLTHINT